MVEEILCVVKWRKAQHTKTYVSIYAASKVQNLLARTLPTSKIVNDEIIFVQGKVAKAEHTKTYVSISLSDDLCKKNSSERFFTV